MKVLLLAILIFSSSAFADMSLNNCQMTTQTDFGATTVSTRALLNSPYRKCLIFQSKTTATLYIKFGSAHGTTSPLEGFVMSGASTFWAPIPLPTNSIYIKSSAGIGTVTILEGR